jgi:hypothetical protein
VAAVVVPAAQAALIVVLTTEMVVMEFVYQYLELLLGTQAEVALEAKTVYLAWVEWAVAAAEVHHNLVHLQQTVAVLEAGTDKLEQQILVVVAEQVAHIIQVLVLHLEQVVAE